MSLSAKRFIALLLLVVFLMPATGLMLYVHKCNISNSTVYNTGEQEFCCSLSSHGEEEHQHTLAVIDDSFVNETSNLSALPCCEDTGIFVKISDVFVSQSLNILYILLPTFILSNTIYLPIDNLLTGNNILYDQSESPPELPPYLKYLSLRL